MKNILFLLFTILLTFNVILTIKYIDSKNIGFVEYVKGDCFLRFNKGIVDIPLDTISNNNGFIKVVFINEFGMGCDNVDFKDSCQFLRYKIRLDSDKFNINGLILPVDSIFWDSYDVLEKSNLWINHIYSIKLKNCGRIIGYRTFNGDTIKLKYNNNLLLGDLKIDRQENKAFKFIYIVLIILNLIILIMIIYNMKLKGKD